MMGSVAKADKVGGTGVNHNEALAAGLRVKSAVKAGGVIVDPRK